MWASFSNKRTSPRSSGTTSIQDVSTAPQKRNHHTIVITEATPRTSISDDGPPFSTIRISVDTSIHFECPIQDPFSPEQHEECKWYLDECLRYRTYDAKIVARADQVKDEIVKYGERLLNQINWHGVEWKHDEIRIDIRQSNHGRAPSKIHHLHWEQLEDGNWWPRPQSAVPPTVKVRRVIGDTPTAERPAQPQVRTYNNPGYEANILLVIARDLTPLGTSKKRGSELEDVSPAMAYRAIINAQDTLSKKPNAKKINLEVVRPGSFKALKEHLTKTRVEKGLGYFHLIHFDVHGEVSKNKEITQNYKAYLNFANPDIQDISRLRSKGVGKDAGDLDLGTESIRAEDVADLLHEHRISRAVLTACQSGKADLGDDANLCRIFALKGITQILAISFGICSYAVEILCESFYKRLLVDDQTFSDAANSARGSLRRRPKREGLWRGKRLMMDWFIPVAYVSPEERPIIQEKPKRYTQYLEVPGIPLTRTPSASSMTAIYRQASLDDRRQYLEPDIDVLRFEVYLITFGTVLLHVPDVAKHTFLNQLLKEWKGTNFLKHYEKISADAFLEPKADGAKIGSKINQKLRDHTRLSEGLKNAYLPYAKEKWQRISLRKIAVVVEDIDCLFPEIEDSRGPSLKAAKDKFGKFLQVVVEKPRLVVGKEYKVPYLIILGGKDHTGDFIKHYSNLGARTLKSERVGKFAACYSMKT